MPSSWNKLANARISWLFHAFSQLSTMAVICSRSALLPGCAPWLIDVDAMDKKPVKRNASLPMVPANLRVIRTPVPDVRTNCADRWTEPQSNAAILTAHDTHAGSDGLVLLFGQGRLAEIGQQLI